MTITASHQDYRSNERPRSMDYARLLDAAHQQLAGPIVLVWTISMPMSAA
jgi:hypothetical protein